MKTSHSFVLLGLTLAVWAVLAAILAAPALAGGLADRLGDTDDALRLALVRDLIQGHAGWYDQHYARLQPPLGMDLHWSRLVDGGIAGLELVFRLFLAPAQAEYAARVAWPLLWIGPAVAAILSIARSLRGEAAAFACAALLSVTYLIFWQWGPGRIDHHDLQMTAALCALAGAVAGSRRGAWLAGVATGCGLAVGLEALLFLGLIGAAFALRFAFDAVHARSARAYAVALLASLTALYLIETPPAWWGLARCDALGANLVAAVAVACLGLLATTQFFVKGAGNRFAGLAATGALAAGVYLGLQPACIGGPFALSDPRIGAVWLSKVAEMQPLAGHVRKLEADALTGLGFLALGVVGWLWLGRGARQRTPAWLIVGGCFLLAGLLGVQTVRLIGYATLFAVPIVAAAATDLAGRFPRGRLTWAVVLAVALSPSWPAAAIAGREPKAPLASGSCTAPSAFATLARQPRGLVLNEIDLGPYILATTAHAVLAAPYHRADWGILAADAALAAPPGRDEAAARRLHADYVVVCRSNAANLRRKEIGPASLQVRLDRGRPPAWLQPLSAPGVSLQVYRVRPARGA